MEISRYLESLALETLGLLPAESPSHDEPLVFVNDFEEVTKQRIMEYGVWYSGDSDYLLNFYNEKSIIEFRTEPWFWKNKRSLFWSRASQENEIKRTHSGFARDMVDTIVSICGTPVVKIGSQEGQPEKMIAGFSAQKVLEGVLESNDFWSTYRQEQMPMTLVEGWGAYKITWDTDNFGDDPFVYYYRAENVRVYRRGNRLYGMTFLDWYRDGKGTRYLVAETRVMSHGKGTFRVDCFKEQGNGLLTELSKADVPQLGSVSEWTDMPCLFAVPCHFYKDTLYGYEGRSIYQGKIDVFDDIDQALSQASNTIRRSTPVEQFDLDFCERNRDGSPKMPKLFERRYVAVRGAKGADGSSTNSSPVTVTQPQLNTQMYGEHILMLEQQAINGHLSPATMGIDVAKKDNGDAQREKEKVTVFTRNHLIKEESKMLASLFNQLLMAKEYLATGRITCDDYEVNVEFDEFSDQSYESKITSLAQALANDAISPEMFVDKVYGKSISDESRAKEIAWLTKKHEAQNAPKEDDMFSGNPFGGEDEPAVPEGDGQEEPTVPSEEEAE